MLTGHYLWQCFLIIQQNEEEIDSFLEEKFDLKKFDRADKFLGIRITRGPDWMKSDRKIHKQGFGQIWNEKCKISNHTHDKLRRYEESVIKTKSIVHIVRL